MIPHRAIGLDPSSTDNTGWGVVDIIGREEIAVAWGVLDAGAEDDHLRALLREYDPAAVGIETIVDVHPVRRKGVDGISTKQALCLYRSGDVAGVLRATARAHVTQPKIHQPTAEQWRRDLIGNAHAEPAQIDRVLRLRLKGFPPPRKSNNHHRDGLGVALHTALAMRMVTR